MAELICYDENFKLVSRISTRDVIQAQYIERIGNYIYLSTNWNNYNSKNVQLSVYDITSNALNELLYVPTKDLNAAIFNKNCQLAVREDSCLFIQSYCYTIFQILDESMVPRY